MTVDRFAKAIGAVLLLVLIKPWGLGLDWQRLSLASLAVMVLWIAVALAARREYLATFRRSLGARQVEPAGVRLEVADASTIEALVEELASADDTRVLYAVDMLEALDKRNLVPRLLLHHESPRVRARALYAMEVERASATGSWLGSIERMLGDEDADVRAAAVDVFARARHEDAAHLMRPYLEDADPRVVVTAAVALAGSGSPADVATARATLTRIVEDQRREGLRGRIAAAAALGRDPAPELRPLLVPLMHDADRDVARVAIEAVERAGIVDPLFVPALVTLLGDRALKSVAREALAGGGEAVLEALAHFLRSPDEQAWVRRHIPVTLAHIPTQRSMDALLSALESRDGFLRFKAIEAIERLRRESPGLVLDREAVERLVVRESSRYFDATTLRYNLLREPAHGTEPLLLRALSDKRARTVDRIFRLLGLLHSWTDVAAARYSIEQGDPRARASAVEYLDNLLSGPVRKRVMPILEGGTEEEQAQAANAALKTRPRDIEDTLAQLAHDDDPVVATTAMYLVAQTGRWALSDDLDFVASRATGEPYVRDAARWALSVRDHRDAANEQPVVAVVDRLQALPLFEVVSVDESFRITTAGHRVSYRAGDILCTQGDRPGEMRFLLEGAVAGRSEDGGPEVSVDAPATLVFEEVLAGRPLSQTLRAAEPCACLTLDRDAFLTTLSDNIALAKGLFRTLFGASESRRQHAGRARPGSPPPPGGSLQPIDVVLALRRSAWLSSASVEQVLDLAAVAREVTLLSGTLLFGEHDRPAVYHVLDGEIRLEGPGSNPLVGRTGDAIGVAETLAGTSFGGRAVVAEAGRALRLDSDVLYEVLDEHADLLESTFRGVLRTSDEGA